MLHSKTWQGFSFLILLLSFGDDCRTATDHNLCTSVSPIKYFFKLRKTKKLSGQRQL